MNFSWIKKKISKHEDESDIIFSLSGGRITLETTLGLRSTGRCGISFKSMSGMQFNAIRDTVEDSGYLPFLLASVFQFQTNDTGFKNKAYLIYNHKRKNFYPFAPIAKQERNSEYELKIMAVLSKEIPFETNISLWYPLWNIPV